MKDRLGVVKFFTNHLQSFGNITPSRILLVVEPLLKNSGKCCLGHVRITFCVSFNFLHRMVVDVQRQP